MANTNLTLSSGESAKEKKLQSKCEQTCQLPTWPSFSFSFSLNFRFRFSLSFSFNLSASVSTSTSAWIVLRFGFEFGNWREHERTAEARGPRALELNCKEPKKPESFLPPSIYRPRSPHNWACVLYWPFIVKLNAYRCQSAPKLDTVTKRQCEPGQK